MFVALALTSRRRGMESAPALVGAMASAARRSWSTSTMNVTDSSGSFARATASRSPWSTLGVRSALITSRHCDIASSSAARRMMVSATSSAYASLSSPSPTLVPAEEVSQAVSSLDAGAPGAPSPSPNTSPSFFVLFLGFSESGRSSSRTSTTRFKYSAPSSVFSCLRVTRTAHASRKNVNPPSAMNRNSGGTSSSDRAASFFADPPSSVSSCFFEDPSNSNSSSLSSSLSASVNACCCTRRRTTFRLSVARHMKNPASVAASGCLDS